MCHKITSEATCKFLVQAEYGNYNGVYCQQSSLDLVPVTCFIVTVYLGHVETANVSCKWP